MSDHVEVLRTLRDRLPRAERWLHEIDALNAAIDSLRQVPGWYVLVPREPTTGMTREDGRPVCKPGTPMAKLLVVMDTIRRDTPASPAQLDTLHRILSEAADGFAAIANPAPPTSGERKFRGIGELERSGYIPEGSADEREATPAQAGAVAGFRWDLLPSYLIDHCEGDIISEEGLQRAVAAMLHNPRYNPPAEAQAGAELPGIVAWMDHKGGVVTAAMKARDPGMPYPTPLTVAAVGNVCDQLRPGARCPTPESCRENGCNAVEREIYEAIHGDRTRNEAFNLADTVIEHMQCGREQEARAAIMEAFSARRGGSDG